MFYGFKRSTDMRDTNTKVAKFKSKDQLLQWMGIDNGKLTHDDPVAARNYHHDFKYGFELEGKVDKKDAIFKERGSTTYPLYENDLLYLYVSKHGIEIERY